MGQAAGGREGGHPAGVRYHAGAVGHRVRSGRFRGLALPIMWANGGKLFDDDNPRSLSLDRPARKGCRLADMYTKYRVVAQMADATAVGMANPNAMVGAGQVAFNYSSLTWRGYRRHTFKSDVQMLPRASAVGGQHMGWLPDDAQRDQSPDAR